LYYNFKINLITQMKTFFASAAIAAIALA